MCRLKNIDFKELLEDNHAALTSIAWQTTFKTQWQVELRFPNRNVSRFIYAMRVLLRYQKATAYPSSAIWRLPRRKK